MRKRGLGAGWIAEYSGGMLSVKRESTDGLLTGVWLMRKTAKDLSKFLNGDQTPGLVTDEVKEFLKDLGEERTTFLRFFLNELGGI